MTEIKIPLSKTKITLLLIGSLGFVIGGAITAKSNPIKEYEECLIKAKAMREALE